MHVTFQLLSLVYVYLIGGNGDEKYSRCKFSPSAMKYWYFTKHFNIVLTFSLIILNIKIYNYNSNNTILVSNLKAIKLFRGNLNRLFIDSFV